MENSANQQYIGVYSYPSLVSRVQAMFCDVWIILGLFMYFSSTFFEDYEGRFVGLKILAFFLILLIYEPIGIMTGGTIGYRTMGLKIRRFNALNKKIRFSQAFLRSFMKLSLGWVSVLTISLDPHRRAFHDKASGTIVLVERNSKQE